MKVNFLTSFALQIYAINVCCIVLVQSCHFQLINNDGSKTIETVSQDKQKTVYVRKIHPHKIRDGRCGCGHIDRGRNKRLHSWDVFVYIREANHEKFIRSCAGAIIAHNLVLTSHKCLMLKGKQMRPYEAWRPTPQHIEHNTATAENVMIGTFSEENVFVKNITYNSKFSLYASATDVASGDDIAIIVVKDDLFEVSEWPDDDGNLKTEHRFYPICLPETNKKMDLSKDILHRYSYYGGFGGIFEPEPNAKTLEVRFADELVILDGKECDGEQNFGDYSTSGSLCIRSVVPLPSFPGSLLLTNANDGKEFARPLPDQPVFLAGLGTVTEKRPPGKHISYAYFGNVFKHLDTIEKVAKEHNSFWCFTPPYLPSTANRVKLEEWHWESGTDNILRSETLDCACGLKNSDAPGKVAGGEDAIPYEFGWMVKLLSDYGTGPEFRCGASIINDRVMLTAAHCFFKDWFDGNFNILPLEDVRVVAVSIGAHHFKNGKEEILLKAKQIISHPGYILNKQNNEGVFSFDLALIILEEPLKFANATTLKTVKHNDIRPICLPKVNDKIKLNNGTSLTLSGWGLLNPWAGNNKTYPVELQKLQVEVRDLKYCASKYNGITPDTVFCVGNFTPKLGPTPGDSGSPLAYRKSNGQYFEVGIVSYGNVLTEDTDEDWVDFIADVQQFVPFIEYYSNLNGARWCKH